MRGCVRVCIYNYLGLVGIGVLVYACGIETHNSGGRDSIMAFVNLPFGLKVEVSWTTGSGIAVCVHWVSRTTPVSPVLGDLTNVMDDFDTWRTAIRSLQPPTIQIAGIRATDWNVASGITAFSLPAANVAGTNASTIAPLNVAICASHRSGFTGRSRRGRNYIPGIGENVVSNGDLIGSTFQNTLATAYAALRTNLLTHGYVQVAASFVTNGAPRANGLGTAIATTIVDQYSDSQRRRLAGRGA